MNKFIKKIFKKDSKISSNRSLSAKTIEQETNEVFEKYEKSFKDLARYDRGEKISATN